MRPSRLLTVLHGLAFLFTLGLGVTAILTGAGVLSVGSVSAAFSDAGWTILVVLVGVAVLLTALHFLLVLADDRRNEVLYSRAGELGRVEVSPTAVREFISGILRKEIGIDRFRVFLRRREDGVAIRVRTALTPDQRVTDAGERIQRELTRHVADRTGVEVREVTVFVRSIRARDTEVTTEETVDDAYDA
jgi:uncharacterized alkaline shock family protein YloU